MIRIILYGILALFVAGAAALYFMAPTVNIPLALFTGGIEADETALQAQVDAPEDFRFTVFAKGLPNARMLKVTPHGDLLVSTPRSGEVHLLYKDENKDGQSDGRMVLMSGLNRPHGLEIHDGWLYVAEVDGVGRVPFDAAARSQTGAYERLVEGLPDDGNHWSKTVRMGPDGWLYLSIGSSCNVCIEEDERRAAMLRLRPDGSEVEIFATGLRNTVDFDWSPADGALYGTDNGRDLLGDDFPPEELNRIEKDGFYGWPFINGFGDSDPDLGGQGGDLEKIAQDPAHGFRAHNAPLGMTFLRHQGYPENFHHNALVALHGSWNRSEKDGYKVVRLRWGADGRITEHDFLTGFLRDGSVIGRPVDVEEAPSGEIFISDDFNGSIYRLAFGEDTGLSHAGIAPQERPAPLAEAVYSKTEIASGAEIFEASGCLVCHGEEGAVNAMVPLVRLRDRYDLGGLEGILEAPPSSMPKVEFTEEERRLLAVYLLAKY